MKNIFIFGAGGFASEIYYWLNDVIKQNKDIRFGGFIADTNKFKKDALLTKYYIGREQENVFKEDDYAIVAIGDVYSRKQTTEKLISKNINLFNLIHPSAILGDVAMGQGNVICPYCVFTSGIKIGSGNIFNLNVTVGHDVVIGSYNTFNSQADITGGVIIGNLNYFGSRVSMLPKAKLGDRCKIAAGSVVYKGFKDDAIALGNPASEV